MKQPLVLLLLVVGTALMPAARGQEFSDSLSTSIEKAQALDRESRQVCHIDQLMKVNWESAKQTVRSAENFEMKKSRVVALIPNTVMFVRQVLVADLADCAYMRQSFSLEMTQKLQHASWDLDYTEQKLLEKRLLNTLLIQEMDEAKQKEH